jgi:EAL domain-containing protein (putative c-di-GMP-specific phosphodiesterase class I)
VGSLIANYDDIAYREEVRDLVEWCQESNLSLDINITIG